MVTCAEINHLDETLVFHIDEDILRLQVTMSHVLVVTVGNRLQDLLDDQGCLVLGNVLPGDDLFE